MSAVAIYVSVAGLLAVLTGYDSERGDELRGAFALIYCALWPLGGLFVLGCMVRHYFNRREPRGWQ